MARRSLLEELLVKISGDVDSLRRDMGQSEQIVKQRTDNMGRSMERFHTSAVKAATRIGGALAAAFSVRAVASFTSETLKAAETIQRQADSFETSAERIQELQFTFRQFDLESDDVADALGTLADRAQDAADGTQSFIDDFRLLGIEVDELRGKSPDELLRLVAERVAEIEDPTQRAAAVVRTFGDDLGRKLLPLLIQGAEKFDALAGAAHDAGVVMEDDVVAGASAAQEAFRNLRERGVNYLQAGFAELIVDAAEWANMDLGLDRLQALEREARKLREERERLESGRALPGDRPRDLAEREAQNQAALRFERQRLQFVEAQNRRPNQQTTQRTSTSSGGADASALELVDAQAAARRGMARGRERAQRAAEFPELQTIEFAADDTADNIEDRWENLGDSMGRALEATLTDAFLGIETDFDDMLMRLGARAAVSQLFSVLSNIGGGGQGTVGGFFGNVFGRQHGGPVMQDQPVLVGERRPEIFVPNTAGRIEPRVSRSQSSTTLNQEINVPLAFPPQLEAYVRNVAGPAGRDAALEVLRAERGTI